MKTLIVSCMLAVSLVAAGSVLAEEMVAAAGGKSAEEKVHRATVDDGVQRVDVLGGSYFYRPKHIIVKVNVPVELKVKKESGVTPHNIVIKAPEAGIEFDVAMGTEPKVIKFTPKKTGKYTFYCSKKLLFFESHKDKGMKGTLEVVD